MGVEMAEAVTEVAAKEGATEEGRKWWRWQEVGEAMVGEEMVAAKVGQKGRRWWTERAEEMVDLSRGGGGEGGGGGAVVKVEVHQGGGPGGGGDNAAQRDGPDRGGEGGAMVVALARGRWWRWRWWRWWW